MNRRTDYSGSSVVVGAASLNLRRPGDRPPMGGWRPGIQFSALQASIVNAVADLLIPAGAGFPAPSQVDVLGFFARYIAPEGVEPKWYPFVGEIEFKRGLGGLGENFLRASQNERQAHLEELEKSDPAYFTVLLEMTYYAYYSRPPVIIAITRNLEAGADMNLSPQPYGYSDSIEEWDESLFQSIPGTYLETHDVQPVRLRDATERASGGVES